MSDAATPTQPQSTEAELIAVRREKLAKLRELGIDPFGARFPVSTTPAELFANFEEGKQVKVAGRITALRGAFQDVTELVAMRSQADALAQRLAQTLENLSEAFLILDKDWRFSFVNQKAEQVLGLGRDSLLGRPFGGSIAGSAAADTGPQLFPELKQAFETQTALRIPQYFSQALNIWLEISASRITTLTVRIWIATLILRLWHF